MPHHRPHRLSHTWPENRSGPGTAQRRKRNLHRNKKQLPPGCAAGWHHAGDFRGHRFAGRKNCGMILDPGYSIVDVSNQITDRGYLISEIRHQMPDNRCSCEFEENENPKSNI